MNTIKNLTIIDDDDIFVYLTTRLIEQTKMVDEINVFDNGLEAIEFLKANKHSPELLPELVFLDLSMPIMDGWQFLNEYTSLSPHLDKKVTIYVLSSSISPDEVARAKTISEVSDYLIKPISKDRLVHLISSL